METKISAVIITYNEEKNIEKCLKSLVWVDEIIVVDSFSTDNTISIATKYTKKIFQKKFESFSSQRNFAIEKATGEWIFVLDADEVVSEELKDEIKSTILNSKDNISGYYVLRLNFSFGKLLKHGVKSPDYVLRLFKKGSGSYKKDIHEILNINGKVGYLKGFIIHKNYQSISEYISKFNFYTDLEAKEMFKNKIKISWFKIIFYPILRFFWSYILKNGWKDGFAGFLMSIYSSIYMLTKYLKYKELKDVNRH